MNNLWICELVLVLVIPVLVFAVGRHFVKKGAPEKFNAFFGYRTTRSMQTWETWTFAHAKLGRLWSLFGLIMIPVSAGLFAILFKQSEDTMSIFGLFIMLLQTIAIAVSIILIEKSLKANFNERGERTEESLAEEQKKLEEKNAKALKKAEKKK